MLECIKTKAQKVDKIFFADYLFSKDRNIPKVGHDNGTEFEQYFKQVCEKLNIKNTI